MELFYWNNFGYKKFGEGEVAVCGTMDSTVHGLGDQDANQIYCKVVSTEEVLQDLAAQ